MSLYENILMHCFSVAPEMYYWNIKISQFYLLTSDKLQGNNYQILNSWSNSDYLTNNELCKWTDCLQFHRVSYFQLNLQQCLFCPPHVLENMFCFCRCCCMLVFFKVTSLIWEYIESWHSVIFLSQRKICFLMLKSTAVYWNLHSSTKYNTNLPKRKKKIIYTYDWKFIVLYIIM